MVWQIKPYFWVVGLKQNIGSFTELQTDYLQLINLFILCYIFQLALSNYISVTVTEDCDWLYIVGHCILSSHQATLQALYELSHNGPRIFSACAGFTARSSADYSIYSFYRGCKRKNKLFFMIYGGHLLLQHHAKTRT